MEKRTIKDILEEMWELSYENETSEESHIEADNLLLEALQIASKEGLKSMRPMPSKWHMKVSASGTHKQKEENHDK